MMVEEMESTVFLSGSEVFCPQEKEAVYQVESGTVFVFIVPVANEKLNRRLFLCEVPPLGLIPSYVYRDQDYKQWRFALMAKENAGLRRIKYSATSVLYQKFLLRAGIDTYKQEGFEGSLKEYYKREILKEKVSLGRGNEAEPEAKESVLQKIVGAFHKKETLPKGDNVNYLALAFLCGRLGLPVLDEDSLAARCGKKIKDADVMELAQASNMICRKVVLDADWYRNDCGALIGTMNEKTVACIPGKRGVYEIFYAENGQVERLTSKVAHQINPQAYAIGRTLPAKVLSRKDIIRFCRESISPSDFLIVAILGLICALIGILLPTINQMVYDDYIPLGNIGQLGQLCVVMLSFMIGNVFFSIVKNLSGLRLKDRVGNDLQSAVYHRVFHLPESFFHDYDSADLARRIMSVSSAAASIANTVILTGMSALFSVVYLIRMCTYSGKLTWIGAGMYALYSLLILWISTISRKHESRIMEADGEASAKLYQYLDGVDKIRMAGVEDRALLSYMYPYSRQQSEEIKMNRWTSASDMIVSISSTIFSMVLYVVIVKSELSISVGSFVAFNTAFGSFTGALEGLVGELLQLYREKDVLQRFWPVFSAEPENGTTQKAPPELSGSLRLEHVSFSYTKGGKKVIDDLSLSIQAGEYVGIVGSSGCGKSTLLKLLLGFETPDTGMVLVDNGDLKTMDKGAYRRQLGVVLQNGKLIAGSIYENITITAPNATMKRVNEVIDAVGLREDIDQMPMGIHTMLSENCGTISGGQQQRILIARAIISNPSLLIFDEATSALDNLTQAAVSKNLDKMNITRIVVAHRLSTIKNCDRILVLNDGKIAEEGNYDTLMAKHGLFYALASRQIAE